MWFSKIKWIRKNVPYILSKANLLIFNHENNDLLRYGASLNKMFEYFAAGKPVTTDCEFGYDLIKKYDAGFIFS